MTKAQRLRALAKKTLVATAAGAKGSAIALASGAATFQAHKWLGRQSWAPANPVVIPLMLGVAGHIAKKKAPSVGVAVLGAAGYAANNAYEVYAATQPQKSPDAQGFGAFADAGFVQQMGAGVGDARGFDAGFVQGRAYP
jgi:hypothetical protein